MNPSADGNTPPPDIKDIAGPETLLNLWEVLALVGGIVLALALLGVAGFILYQRLTREAATPEAPLDIARRRLAQLAGQRETLAPNAFSLAVSDTLKDYLTARFGDPLRYETSEEFLQRLSQAEANALPVSLRGDVAGFLAVADEIKYGRPPDAEARKGPLLELAREVLREPPAPPQANGAGVGNAKSRKPRKKRGAPPRRPVMK